MIRWTRFLFYITFLSLFLITGCSSQNSSTAAKTHHEHDFENNSNLHATIGDTVVVHLEHPSMTAHENDTHTAGIDQFKVRFDTTEEHTFRLNENNEGHYYLLKDVSQNVVVTVNATTPTVNKIITAGSYTLEIHHGQVSNNIRTLFFQPGSVLVSKDCDGCDLSNQDLSYANMSDGSFIGTNFYNSDLSNSDISYANLSRATMTEATMTAADLSGTNLRGTLLDKVDLSQGYLDNATMDSDTRLDGSTFTNTSFSQTIYTDGRICADSSVGGCQ